MNISNKDLEYIGGRKFASAKIASAFWIHPKLIWYEGTTGSYSEIKEIRREIHETTIRWFELYIENIMNTLIDKFWKDLEFDLIKYNIVLFWLLTPNQIFKDRWLPIISDEFWESRYIASNLVKIGAENII